MAKNESPAEEPANSPKEKISNNEKGDSGELLAAEFLSERGYSIRHCKWKFGKYEIDIVAEKGRDIVFVEVKTRYSNIYGEPWEAVNRAKRRRICASADAYIRQFQSELNPRFDIISILKTSGKVSILHIEEAFYPLV